MKKTPKAVYSFRLSEKVMEMLRSSAATQERTISYVLDSILKHYFAIEPTKVRLYGEKEEEEEEEVKTE